MSARDVRAEQTVNDFWPFPRTEDESVQSILRRRVIQEMQAAYARGFAEAREQDLQIAEKVAREVGGNFWDTHRLNTGLLRFIAAIRALEPEE